MASLRSRGSAPTQLRSKYPHLIVVGHKGFLSGPYEHRPALDEVVQMMSGLAAMTGTKEKPQRVGSSANDIMGGMFGVISILAALYQKRAGKADGANIRIGLFENCLFLVAQHMVEFEMTGNRPRSMPEREHAWPIYDIFDTRRRQPHFHRRGHRGALAELLQGIRPAGISGRSEPSRTTTDRILARSRIIPRVAEVIKGWDVKELSRTSSTGSTSASRRSTALRTCSDDPHVLRPGGLVNNFNADGAAFRVPALPIEWNGNHIGEGLKVPPLGGDTDAVRTELAKKKLSKRKETRMTDVQKIYPEGRVMLREVGLRDGLQLVKTVPSTDAKQRWVRDEYAAGVRCFEVGSFLPAKTFPQFVDVRESCRPSARCRAHTASALALNERGVNEAMASGVAEIGTVVSATEEHSQANANRSRESAIANVKRLCDLRDASAHKPIINVGISMALGCSITGAVDPKEVIRLVEKCLEVGVDAVAIADTVGYAGPKAVGELTRAAVKVAGDKPIIVHLHDTRGMGIANASAALDEGARVLDGSLGGLGGCPFAPGATGNVVFEDLAFLCESKGFATGIDIDRLVAVRSILREAMPNEPLYGGMARAGLPCGTAAKAA